MAASDYVSDLNKPLATEGASTDDGIASSIGDGGAPVASARKRQDMTDNLKGFKR